MQKSSYVLISYVGIIKEMKIVENYEMKLGKPSLKKTIFLLTFVNKDFTPPPLIIDEKPLRFGGPVRGVTPPPYKSEK